MSTVAQIESAIEKLSPEKVEELAAWLDEHRQSIRASAALFGIYEAEEKQPG